jgi:hypothetical protein
VVDRKQFITWGLSEKILIRRLKKNTRNLSSNIWFLGLYLKMEPYEQKATYSMHESVPPGVDISPHFQDFFRFSKTKVPLPN